MDLERCLNDAVRSTWLNPVVCAPGSSGIDCGLKDAQDRACCGGAAPQQPTVCVRCLLTNACHHSKRLL